MTEHHDPPPESPRVRLRAGDTMVDVDLVQGARLADWRVGDRQLVLTEGAGPLRWGCYPMVPWAGRVRDGRFDWDGRVQLERPHGPHALHGLAHNRVWKLTHLTRAEAECSFDLDRHELHEAGWHLGGIVQQVISVRPGIVRLELRLQAGQAALPAVIGWHPWFPRLQDGVRGQVVMDAGQMYLRGPDGLPTGRLVDTPEGPWDDCFTNLRRTPHVWWPGVGRVQVASDLDHLVVYDQDRSGIAMEPQSGPPDEFNRSDRRTLPAGGVLQAWMELRWLEA